MDKTDTMLLIEARDAKGRDIRDILCDFYRRGGNLGESAALLSKETGVDIDVMKFHRMVKRLGGSVKTIIEFPASTETAGVA